MSACQERSGEREHVGDRAVPDKTSQNKKKDQPFDGKVSKSVDFEN